MFSLTTAFSQRRDFDPPVADFTGTPATLNPGDTVFFTDLTTNDPVEWNWTIFPESGWNFTDSTNQNSQHPVVRFTSLGVYSVTLTAYNNFGFDSETKQNFLNVTIVSEPCDASVDNCSEYISLVQLAGIENPSLCTKYISYTEPQATLMKGEQYTLIVTPSIDGAIGAYPNDEIAAWIDWNHDYDFNDENEQIGYVLVDNDWSNHFIFEVPETANTGPLNMRIRISFLPSEGPIEPCGATAFGEVEDYIVNVVSAPLSVAENSFTGFQIFPNPGSGFVVVDSGETEVLNVEVTDLTGKVIIVKDITNKEAIDVSRLSRGSYLFRITCGNKMIVEPFIKQ